MKKIKSFFKNDSTKNVAYIILTVSLILVLWLLAGVFKMDSFFREIESKSYDLRLKWSTTRPQVNKDIAIIAIDDNSIEFLEDEYGRWPWSRNAYTDLINYLEKGHVKFIAFDLMFIGKDKGLEHFDKQLVNSIVSNDNVYVSINFDGRSSISKTPPVLPDKLKANFINKSNINFSALEFNNCRMIMKEIIDGTKNIANINFWRDNDGISRRAPIVSKYKNDFYPYLAVKLAHDYFKTKDKNPNDDYFIDENGYFKVGDNTKVPLDKNGFMILDWYGKSGSFERIPFYKIIKSMKALEKGKIPEYAPEYFKDKVLFVGVTVTSSHDIKSIPLEAVYPGVEIQATSFNNLIEGNAIRKLPKPSNVIIAVSLMAIVGLVVLNLNSSILATLFTIVIALLYGYIVTLALNQFNIWIDMVYPLLGVTLTFTIMYIIKYVNKSRDLEYTYKLATTDGLTGLYNHRYFQEQMRNNIENSKRYNACFSLLLIDIDFFKKFNDTYGHQAGDAVLKQVAQLLKKSVRSSDLVARYGGEEMAILLTNTDLDEAYITANKICKTIANKQFKLSEDITVNVTISLGVATCPHHYDEPTEIIEFADQGLYVAKESGRNQVGKIKGYKPTKEVLEKVNQAI